MSKNLLITIPPTRINDLFVNDNSSFNFSPILKSYKDPIIEGRPNIDNRVYAEFYKKIGVDLVVETAMHYPYNFITEKTFRPIANGRPFIIIGPFRTLFFLKSLGFLTFSSIIDESYDDIECPNERFQKVCQIVINFIDRPIDLVIKDITSINLILKKNQDCLSNLESKQLTKFEEQIKIDSH